MRTILSVILMLMVCCAPAQRYYLSGVDSDHAKPWDFYCSKGQNAGKWKKIAVPSCWELQGFGAYTYGRFYTQKGSTPSDESGRYRTTFSVARPDYDEAVYRLVFEGSMTDTQVWIDGRQVGEIHQGGFTEFSYDITSFVIPGRKQTLEVMVSKESANASVNSAERRADWWLFGGIYRPVYIEALPKEHIENLAVDARANGDVYVNIANLDLVLEGKPIAYDAEAGCFHCGKVKTWDPEHPNLYTATFSLKNGRHSITQKIGFRTIEFRPHDGIYLNGTRLVVKGTNRHCFHPEKGRAVSRHDDLMDARLIKQMNMNAVRCHYPSNRSFLEICDSIGLLYLDEFPGWQTHYDDATSRRLLPEFIRRDMNHPCVFIWSNGNEGGWNTSVDHLFSELDIQKRKVIHPWADFDGIDTHHYPAYQTGTYRMQNGDDVFMPTEFLHGKYDKGQGAALEDMWTHWTSSPLFAGGFLWAYVDEAVRRTDLPIGKSKGKHFADKGFNIKDCILDSDGGNGPDGCVDSYRQPEASFFTIREVWSPVYIDRIHITPSFDGRFLVSNHYLFTNLDECSMTYRVLRSKGGVMAHGDVSLPALDPNETGYAKFDMPKDFWRGDILELVAYNAAQEVTCRWSYPIHRAEEQLSDIDLKSAKQVEKGLDLIPVGTSRIEDVRWYELPDGRLYMDARLFNNQRTANLTDESRWQVGVSFDYPETDVDSVTWEGRGPYRVWRNRLKGQQYGIWSLAYNNTVTGQYNSAQCPVYPEFKGYRSEIRWVDILNKDKTHWKVTSLTENLYLRLFTPEEAIDQTPGEMTGVEMTVRKKQERTMIPFPAGNISFLLSIPPMQSYKPLEQLGPHSQPDNIRIKSGDEGFHIRLIFETYK
ncbi:MAG: glycoside hydrolase family 2 TIM barrel-domain containing protein [Prevotella sp.]|nr:glycoside hydrolase family 2 TIM barrel-domain containing protein [Prevotella sp.]